MAKGTAESIAVLRERFGGFDDNGDGRIHFAEFRELLAELGETLSDAEAGLAFDACDLDGDGAIDFEEFRTWWQA